MYTETPTTPVSRKMLWAGRIVSTLLVLMLVMSAVMKFVKPPEFSEGFAKFGYPENLALGLGILELVCTALYALPQTSALGAILLTGYLGGATATHVRVGDPFIVPVILGVLVWGGLYLRDARLRALLPLRSDPAYDNLPGRARMGLFKKVLLSVVALVVGFAVVVGLLPADFRIVRSTTINAPPAEVFAQVNDFRNWEAWSPWAKLDPACKNTYDGPSAGTGAIFAWEGNAQVGAGRMLVTESRPHELIRIKLDFQKPFESTCTTEYTFRADGKQTVMTWDMSGEKNYVSKAFCLFMNMDKMVGGQFEQGLAQLKAVVEDSAKK